MNDSTRRYRLGDADKDAVQLDEVLEPYHQGDAIHSDMGYADEPYDDGGYGDAQGDEQPYDDSYADEAYADEPYAGGYEMDAAESADGYGGEYDGEYSEYHEEMNAAARFKIAMGVFDTISIAVGVLVILGLVGLLFSLLGWLRTDLLHSALLLQSGLQ